MTSGRLFLVPDLTTTKAGFSIKCNLGNKADGFFGKALEFEPIAAPVRANVLFRCPLFYELAHTCEVLFVVRSSGHLEEKRLGTFQFQRSGAAVDQPSCPLSSSACAIAGS